ncbi:hypothetical protein [Melissospora conviva]|uniref:hypothetical protein n=1 Tax=Melissospora conviva TaxID=3388432 RepID=UPI003C199814
MDTDTETAAATTVTVKAGSIGHWWHAAHLTASALTLGWWVVVYAGHLLYTAITRPTMTLRVPDGHTVAWRDGHPTVLAPDEYLERRPVKQVAGMVVAYGLAAATVVAVTAAYLINRV